jgi:hypothetical protein
VTSVSLDSHTKNKAVTFGSLDSHTKD